MNISLPRVRRIALIALGVAITALITALYFANRDSATASHSPSNKVWVSADTYEEMHTQTVPDGADPAPQTERSDVTVLSQSRGRFSKPTDLRLSVTAECALWTNTATLGDDDAETKARVEMWITIDGNVVPVTTEKPDPAVGTVPNSVDPDDQAGRGRVVFCNRANRMKTENIESTTVPPLAQGQPDPEDTDNEDDIVIRSYNRSRSANAFNWAAMNIGSNYDEDYNGKGIVDIVVHARLATSITDDDTTDNNGVDSPAAKAIVGKRTLFVEPVKMANDATF